MPRKSPKQVNKACINEPGELWADIPGYEGIYQASTGEVITSRVVPQYILKQCISAHGYFVVGLRKGTNINSICVHRIMAEAFLPRLPSQAEVHHIDANCLHNEIGNLQWVTKDEHIELHRTRNKRSETSIDMSA